MCNKVLALIGLMSLPVAVLAQETKYRATYYVDGAVIKNENRSNVSLENVEMNSSVVYATNGVELILTRLRLNKTAGATIDENHRINGHNSALLVDGGSKVTLEFSTVNGHVSGADAITATGQGTTLDIVEGSVTVSRSEAAGVNAADGGKIKLDKTIFYTYSSQNPAMLASPGGVIEANGIQGQSSGQASPMCFSRGDLTASGCKLMSQKWSIGSVDGGKLTLTDNSLSAGGVCGFLIYGPVDRSENGDLTLIKNSITVNDGPLFFVTNTSAAITVEGNKISSKSKDLMIVRSDDWGVKGSNGGDAKLTINKQALKGNITVDSISSLQLQINKGGKLKGHINDAENRCAKVKVVIGAGSKWTTKGDNYITSIKFEQPLQKGLKQLKGKHVIYYDPADPDNKALEGKEYKTAGGVLRPLK
ncbi:MAG: hypothetical protein J5763_01360 [Bacteroidaceae bacterium]|nr:hypothetical protein [Bacteroidaceae bacterium]